MGKPKVYIVHSDPGHAWLAVKTSELTALGVAGKVSRYSYQKGGTTYLEEDCDAGYFIDAYAAKHGERPQMRTSYSNGSHKIRNYDRYNAPQEAPKS